MGLSQNYGYLFGGPHHEDYSILGSILGSPYVGKLPNPAGSVTQLFTIAFFFLVALRVLFSCLARDIHSMPTPTDDIKLA